MAEKGDRSKAVVGKTIRGRLRGRLRGQSAIEFALISSFLFLLLFGIAEMGRLLLTFTLITNAEVNCHVPNDPENPLFGEHQT